MSKLLILYGTGEGQTRKVANRMAEIIRGKGHEVIVQVNKDSEGFSTDGFDAAIVGTSIHMGLHQISIRKLVKAHIKAFNSIPVAYFCVCLTAASDQPEDRKQLDKYVADFKSYTGLDPRITAVFAGALRYPYYNFIKRYIMKLIARKLALDTDTKQEYEYTDWAAVDRFTGQFLDMFEQAENE